MLLIKSATRNDNTSYDDTKSKDHQSLETRLNQLEKDYQTLKNEYLMLSRTLSQLKMLIHQTAATSIETLKPNELVSDWDDDESQECSEDESRSEEPVENSEDKKFIAQKDWFDYFFLDPDSTYEPDQDQEDMSSSSKKHDASKSDTLEDIEMLCENISNTM